MTREAYEIFLGARVTKRMNAEILKEQKRLTKSTGLKPSINEVVRLLIGYGLEATAGRRR